MMLAAGRLKDFRACCASVKRVPDEGRLHRSPRRPSCSRSKVGDAVLAVAR